MITRQETLFVSDGGQDIKIELERSGEPVLPRIQRILDRAAPLSTFETWQVWFKHLTSLGVADLVRSSNNAS